MIVRGRVHAEAVAHVLDISRAAKQTHAVSAVLTL